MLRSIQSLVGLALHATDGEIGRVEDSYFDDEKWAVRYLVVKTGKWMSGRKVLISPMSIEVIHWDSGFIPVQLTRRQIQKSPDMNTEQPVSREMEERFYSYYRWPYYWTGAGIWGSGAFPSIPSRREPPPAEAQDLAHPQTHLRSAREVMEYTVESTDAEFGHVHGLFFEEGTWKIRYIMIDTRAFWPGKSKLLPPEWVDSISWQGRKFRIGLSERVIKQGPEYDPELPLDRDFEKRLYGYYGHPGYWETEASPFRKAA